MRETSPPSHCRLIYSGNGFQSFDPLRVHGSRITLLVREAAFRLDGSHIKVNVREIINNTSKSLSFYPLCVNVSNYWNSVNLTVLNHRIHKGKTLSKHKIKIFKTFPLISFIYLNFRLVILKVVIYMNFPLNVLFGRSCVQKAKSFI